MTLNEKLRRLMMPYRVGVVASLAGLSGQTIRNLLAGQQNAKMDTVRALADVLGVEVGWLTDDTKAWPPLRVSPATDREHQAAGAA